MMMSIAQRATTWTDARWRGLGCLLGMLMLNLSYLLSPAAVAADNLRFHGVLSAQPCDLAADDAYITVDMQNILNNVLYQNQRTRGTLFQLNLIDCKPELAKTVHLTFKGQESDELTGYMRIFGSEQVRTGIAIGLERVDGSLIPFNQTTPVHRLSAGLNQITLRAFVRAEPSALANKEIALGHFQAISTFTLSYE